MIKNYSYLFSIISVAVIFTAAAACSSQPKEPTPVLAEGSPSRTASALSLSEGAINEQYTLLELDAAANALKTIFDQSLGIGDQHQGPVLSCDISNEQASAMMMPLKALIDAKLESEKEAYAADSASYAKLMGFESCASMCACGVLATVLESTPVESVSRIAPKVHKRMLAKLQAKAARQTPQASLICAKRQSWFCSSPLRSYLEQEANSSAQ
jgi:hypothetical protein